MSSVVVLDNHRLLCGDATDKGAVAELLDGAEIDLLLTDPPYGIDIVKVGGGNLVPLAEPSLRVSEREREREQWNTCRVQTQTIKTIQDKEQWESEQDQASTRERANGKVGKPRRCTAKTL